MEARQLHLSMDLRKLLCGRAELEEKEALMLFGEEIQTRVGKITREDELGGWDWKPNHALRLRCLKRRCAGGVELRK